MQFFSNFSRSNSTTNYNKVITKSSDNKPLQMGYYFKNRASVKPYSPCFQKIPISVYKNIFVTLNEGPRKDFHLVFKFLFSLFNELISSCFHFSHFRGVTSFLIIFKLKSISCQVESIFFFYLHVSKTNTYYSHFSKESLCRLKLLQLSLLQQ